MDSAPKYNALSYTWGKERSPELLDLGPGVLSITLNLRDALNRIWIYYIQELKEPEFFLWVDAICINQQDIQERGQQVPYMKSIYENAEKVYVFLGYPNDMDQAQLAMHKVNMCTGLWKQACTTNEGAVRAYIAISAHERELFDPNPMSEAFRAWQGIVALCNMPWWSRAWVYQEATVIERGDCKVVFFYGSFVLVWKHFGAIQMVRWVLSESPQLNSSSLQIGPMEAFEQLKRYREEGKLGLLEMLQMFRRTTSTDARDKVYAPLGLVADASSSILKPDYTKSVAEVYTDVARNSLAIPGKELDFLGYVEQKADETEAMVSRNVDELPSWVPNWSLRTFSEPLPKRITNSDLSQGSSSNIYKTDGGQLIQADIEGSNLLLHGTKVGTIIELPVELINQRTGQTYQRWGLESTNAEDLYRPTGESIETAWARSAVADVYFDENEDAHRGHAIDWHAAFDTGIDGLSSQDFLHKHQAAYAFRNIGRGRQLCLTDRGYIGLVPKVAIPGDEIYILFGGHVLYVLQASIQDDEQSAFIFKCKHHGEVAQKYKFVGECYLHGGMDGELQNLQEATAACVCLI